MPALRMPTFASHAESTASSQAERSTPASSSAVMIPSTRPSESRPRFAPANARPQLSGANARTRSFREPPVRRDVDEPSPRRVLVERRVGRALAGEHDRRAHLGRLEQELHALGLGACEEERLEARRRAGPALARSCGRPIAPCVERGSAEREQAGVLGRGKRAPRCDEPAVGGRFTTRLRSPTRPSPSGRASSGTRWTRSAAQTSSVVVS